MSYLGNWINSVSRMVFEAVVLALSLYQVLKLYQLDRRIAARKDSLCLLTARSGEFIKHSWCSVSMEFYRLTGFIYFL